MNREFKNKEFRIETYFTSALFVGCILFIFANIGLYPLIDIDETRYVNMSKYMYFTKSYLAPILNFEPFLEKPPLYFWLNVLSFKFFNTQSAFAGRFATGLLGSLSVFYTYYFVNKISYSKFFGFLAANVLLGSAWFLVFTHIAILDLNFMALSMAAIYSAVLPLFVHNEKNKKYCWWLGYIFMGLAILAKGFIGLAIPCMVVFFTYLILGKIKELFKLINLIPGIIILLLIALPWHILMYKTYGSEWVNIYILKHHFARLLTSEDLGRKQPFLFYIPIILIGLIPWVFNFIVAIIKDLKAFILKIKNSNNFKDFFTGCSNDKKITVFAYTYAICVFLFFSSASTKLPPYILVMFPALSIIIARLWYKAIISNEDIKQLKISNYINSTLFLIVSILGIIISCSYRVILPDDIEFYVENATGFALPAFIYIFIIALSSIISNKKNYIVKTFILNLGLMLGIVFVTFSYGIQYYTSFAQDELEEYAKFINNQKNSQTVTYGFSAKYSILNNKKKIKYIIAENQDEYKELINFIQKNKKRSIYVLTRTKVDDLDNKKEFIKIKEGKVYKIFVYKPKHHK